MARLRHLPRLAEERGVAAALILRATTITMATREGESREGE